jgi:plastocyanin
VTIRKALGFASAAALGVAAVLLPAVASSETAPSVEAENYGEYHYWRPATVTVAPGGAVNFANPTATPHGIHWVSTPGGTPACSGTVPVGTGIEHSGTNWSGSCTFASAGTYTYYCTVHGPSMSGTVTVASATGETTPAPGTTTSAPVTTGPTGTTPGAGGQSGAGAGAQLLALKVSTPKAGTFRGSLTIGPEAAGGTLTITLSAKLGGHRLRVGRLQRTYVNQGAQRWSIALSPRAQRALRAKRRLAVMVRIALTPPGGSPLVVTRTLTARA